MSERLQKLMASAGVASRRACEKMIEDGRVTVNGRAARIGESADPEVDEIFVDGKPLPVKPRLTYIMLNKPRGYVTTMSDEQGRKDVSELVKDAGVRLYPVGRLDLNSEGLLIMTNDGDFANHLMHPSHDVRKTYHAWVRGENLAASLEILRGPMELDGVRLRPARVELLAESRDGAMLSFTIAEGRNRQIRRMCETAELYVTRLKRVREGGIELGDLPTGKWRPLSQEEVDKMRGGTEK